MANEATWGGKVMFPGKYIKADDLDKDYPLTIATVTKEKVKMDTGAIKECYAVAFEKATKLLILNKTNAAAIVKSTGRTEAKDWPGRRIVLYATTCHSPLGANTPCVRVRPEPVQAEKEPTDADNQP